MQKTSTFWKSKKVVLTGGSGFLGGFILKNLKQYGCTNVFVPRSKDYDLRKESSAVELLMTHQPNILIHAAGAVGGIGANISNPGKFFYDNAIMGLHVIEAARKYGVNKLVIIGSVCSYPETASIFREDELWDGYPEPTNAPYGLAKKMLLVQAQAYRKQYNMEIIYLLLSNLYGPGEKMDPENSHVTAAIIQKCMTAKETNEPSITLWGNGTQTRDFLFVDDAARGILQASEHYNDSEPLNIGSGNETSIKALADHIKTIVEFKGEINWDTSKPSGQKRRLVDTSRAKQYFGYEPATSLKEGLQQEIHWLNNKV